MTVAFDVIFMGTPDFAVPALHALHDSEHRVRRVVTQPDRPKGRGRKLTPSPIKQAALNCGFEIQQPDSIKTDPFYQSLQHIAPQFLIVVAFGQIIPAALLKLPRIAPVNVHASLLPKYRGPAPIQWAIINGESETGVTTMLMDEGLDTGDILLQAREKIAPDDTAATLHDRLAHLGADLLIETLRQYGRGKIHATPQDHHQASHAPLLKKSDGRINWQMSATRLTDFIRGMTPWPGAFTFYGSERLKIFKARPIRSETAAAPGTVVQGFDDELRIATGKGQLSILQIQGASGKRLRISDFLRGHAVPPGTRLT